MKKVRATGGQRSTPVLVAGTAIALLLLISPAAKADTFKPTRTNDPTPGACLPNDCSLREAVGAANANPGPDRIKLVNRKQPYSLTIPGPENLNAAGDLDVTGPLTIFHPRRGSKATIRTPRVDRLLQTAPGERLTLDRLVLTGGYADTEAAGAIDANGSLKISNSVLRRNAADDWGGAIQVNGPTSDLEIRSTKFVHNSSGDDAGAINFAARKLRIYNSSFRGSITQGRGGDMYISSPDARIVRTKIFGSESDNDGGSIYLNDGTLTFAKSQISGAHTTSTGGAIHTFGSLIMNGSTVNNNTSEEQGGGIFVGVGGGLRMTNSTVSDNQSFTDGGGIAFNGADGAVLLSSTITRNRADADQAGLSGVGGGIYNDSVLVKIRNTILALNNQGATRNDCAGTFLDSLGHNLISTLGPTGSCTSFGMPGDRTNVNPKLKQLSDYGGPTDTVALRAASPAVNGAHRPSSPAKDQRNRKRDERPDIGSFER